MGRLLRYVALLTLAVSLAACGDDEPEPGPTATPTATDSPPPSAPPASEIALPEGFSAYVVAEGFSSPTSLAQDSAGAVYVSERGGPIFRLDDTDDDGILESKAEFASGLALVNGIAFGPDGALYVASQGRVMVVRDNDSDRTADRSEEIIAGLPRGAHQNNGLAFGPDGKLYLTNGSTCNDCEEPDERSAAILQANADGSGLVIYAHGLRNPYDITFDPRGRLWSTDNGSDPPCNTIDELNLVQQGADYGWPYSPACDSLQSGTPPIVSLGFNTASTGLDYYDAEQFPDAYRDDLFITLWGSNATAPNSAGRVLVHAEITETAAGPQVTVEEFGTGFENPIDVIVDRDGTLLVLDFGSGQLYRIIYTG